MARDPAVSLEVARLDCSRVVEERLRGCNEAPTWRDTAYQTVFSDLICADIRERQAAVVVDVGAGAGVIEWLRPVREAAPHLVGIDPSPAVLANPDLDRAICSTMEDADIADLQSDVAYAFNVAEHVRTPEPFLRNVRAMLRPGASFWYLTTNARHPFCLAAQIVRMTGVKQWYRERMREGETFRINDFPSYYRMNRVATVARLASRAGFARLEYAYLPSGWEGYFPPALRVLPRVYDAIVPQHFEGTRLILVCRLVR